MKIPFAPPRIDEEIIQEVTDSLRSGWITTGPKTKALEKELLQYTNSKAVLCVNSATAGMELVLRWFGIQTGDEVILPAYTYCSTANVVIHCGAKPIMVDIYKDDFTIDIKAIEAAITPKTKAIMPVDLGGLPIHYNKLKSVIEKKKHLFKANNDKQALLNRPLLLTDAAHSLGATYDKQAAALQADAAVFSFHAVKNLTTAEGGAICLNLPSSFDNQAIYKTLNTTSLHGQNKDALAKFKGGAWEYDVIEAGYKCNMPDVLAAIGLVEIRRYAQDTLPKRKLICEHYQTAFQKYDWAELPVLQENTRTSSYHLYLLRIKDCSLQQRNEMIQKIAQKEVAVNVHYKPLPLLSFYKKLDYNIDNYPISQNSFERIITLPVFYDMSTKQVDKVIEVLVQAYKSIFKK